MKLSISFVRGVVVVGFFLVALMLALTSNGLAQVAKPKAAPTTAEANAELLKPIVLTADEKKEALDAQANINRAMSETNTLLEAAKAQMTAAQETIKRLQSEFNLYVTQVALKKRVDPDKYETVLAALDDKAEVIGFKPKPPPVPDKTAKK